MPDVSGTHRRGEKQKLISNGAVTSGTARASKTDYTRWRLKDERGCQTWHYLETEEEIEQWPQSLADKWHLGIDLVRKPPSLSNTIHMKERRLIYFDCRIFPIFHLPKRPSNLPRTASPFSRNSNSPPATGPAIMEAPCSSSQASSLPGT
jgi:hypothetical protein